MGTVNPKYAEAIAILLIAVLSMFNTAIDDAQGEMIVAASIAAPEATETPMPECPEGEFYNAPMDRCWPIETPAPEPTWGADIQATMDADLYDNDYQYIGWCFDYVEGGTRIIYYPCDADPESIPPPE